MADATIHGIEFQIVGDTAEATKGINAFTSTLNRLKSATSGGLGLRAVSKDFKLLGSVASGIRGIVSAPFKKSWESVTKYAKSIGGVVSGFKRILGYRLIRTVIKEIGQAFSDGLKNVYGWSKAFGGPVNRAGMTFAQTMDDIATSLAYFKNSVGAAVAPLFNLLAPAIRAVTDAAVQLLNVINQLFARLTGQGSWTRAIRKAEEYESAVGGAGGAAKEALKYLAPFDELNVLPDNSKGGGGGGGGDDYSGIFEEVSEFESGIADFADRVRELIQSGEWAQLGQFLGEKINEIVKNINWKDIGTEVGDKINALFTTEYWTLKTINFKQIGEKVAEFLTGDDGLGGALRSIDFSTFGALISEKLTILPEIIIGAINKLDFGLVGESISNVFKGFFNNLSDSVIEIDWNTTAQNLISGLFDAISGLDISGAANSLGKLFSNIGTAVSSIDWDVVASELWEGLKNAYQKLDFSGFWSGFFNLLGSALSGASSLILQLAKDVLSDFWNAFTKFADSDDDGRLVGEEIVNGIFTGIKNKIVSAYDWIITNVFEPLWTGIKNAFGIHSPAETMIEPGEMIGQGILEGIAKPFTAIADWLDQNVLQPIRNFFAGNGIAELTLPIRTDLSGFKLPDLKAFKKTWDKIKNKKATLTAKLKGTSVSTFKTLSEKWQIIKTKTAELTSKLKNEVPSKTIDWLRNTWSAIQSKTATFTAKLDLRGKIDSFINSWNNLKSKALDLKVSITDSIKSAWNKAAGAWNSSTILSKLGKLPYLANGGILNAGQLFVARENGPEIVGKFGNQTGVLNNKQIVDSVSAGVARAIMSVQVGTASMQTYSQGADTEEMLYRAMLRALNASDREPVEVNLDGQSIYRSVVRRNRMNTAATGVNALA